MTKSETAPGGTASRVVVAEDEALIRLDLVELLGEAGYDVVGQASNGEQAVELTLDLKPDLVIMDVKMPVMDGLSAAEEIGKQRLCPVIMLTAFSQAELVERARDAGVMAYIVKPFTAADLSPAIDIALSRWRELKLLEQEVADLGEALGAYQFALHVGEPLGDQVVLARQFEPDTLVLVAPRLLLAVAGIAGNLAQDTTALPGGLLPGPTTHRRPPWRGFTVERSRFAVPGRATASWGRGRSRCRRTGR